MLSRLRSFFLGLFKRSGLEDNMSDEIRFHLQLRTEDLIRSGLSEEEARRRARLEFGSIESYKEHCRQSLGLRLFDELRGDLRYACRTLRKSPSFTLVAILTLAVGIGVNTALFTIFDNLVFRPIRVQDPSSLYQVWGRTDRRGILSDVTYSEYLELSNRNQVFQQLIADDTVRANTSNGWLGGYLVSGNYFASLGVHQYLGRPILPDDDRPSSTPVVVLSYRAWLGRFGGDRGIVGKSIQIGGNWFTVIGVAPDEFTGIDPEIADLWAPLSAKPLLDAGQDLPIENPNNRWLRIIGRLRPGVSRKQAEVEMAVLLPEVTRSRLPETDRANPMDTRLVGASLESRATFAGFISSRRDDRAGPANYARLIPIFIGFALVLLIACSNLANVQLARAVNRRREIAVRLALGAGRGRVIRQLLTETVLLAGFGGALGLALFHWTLTLVQQAIISKIGGVSIVPAALDVRIFCFAVGLSGLAGLISGLVPALQATSSDVVQAMKEEDGRLGRGIRLRDALVVGQFALSLVLLSAGSLILRRTLSLTSVSPGLDSAHTLFAEQRRSSDAESTMRVQEQLTSLPGVAAVARSSAQPGHGRLELVFLGPGYPAQISAASNYVSSDFFDTLGIPLLQGRPFTAQEAGSEAPVGVVSQFTAQRFWPGEDPIGKQFQIATATGAPSAPRSVLVVGVAGNVLQNVNDFIYDYNCIYQPLAPQRAEGRFVLIRSAGDPASMLTALQSALMSVDPTGQFELHTMDQVLSNQTLPYRVASSIAVALGILGLLLASIGIYGVIAYLVGQRTREMGIRMALGADRRDVLWFILRDGTRLIAISAACGLVLAVGFSRILASRIFRIDPSDPLAFGGATVALVLVGLVASYLPARKATLVDPSVALRYE
jgi:predicted permease